MKGSLVALLAVFLWAQAALAKPTVFLVRHAEKAEPTAENPKDPDLSPAGHARAEALAKMLKDAGITAIYATKFKRTQQTAEPLARDLHLEITLVPAKDTEALVAKIKAATGNVLVVGHSNSIPEIIKALGATTAPTIDERDYDDLFLLTLETASPGLLHLHYD